MKAQRKGREPETGGSDPASPQIGDDHAPSRDSIELSDDRREIVVGEMVEQLGAEHDVDASVAEGKCSNAGADPMGQAAPGLAKDVDGFVDADRHDPGSATRRLSSDFGGDVGEARSDVEQRDGSRERSKGRVHGRDGGAAAAEEAIRS